MENIEILKGISEFKHRSIYGAQISIELVQVFRIKNLLLFAFKLLQKYEQVTQAACSQIKKNVLLNQLQLAEEEVRRLDMQLKHWVSLNKTLESYLKELKEKLSSLVDIPLDNGHTKAEAYCQLENYFDSDIFVNCDDIFYKKVNNDKLTETEFVLYPQRPPLEYYKDLIYLQMHFNLLLVQGFNFALPLLTTKYSFLSRILYWPRSPTYGFLDKSKKLNKKLFAIKVNILICLKELINAIAEVEKWILFSINSYDVFHTFIKAICIRKKELFEEIFKLKFQNRSFVLEHNRLIGAITKADPLFFEKHPYLLSLDSEEDIFSETSSGTSTSQSLSAFSKGSDQPIKVQSLYLPTATKNVTKDSTVKTKSDLLNFNFLPSVFQSVKSKMSSESKFCKPSWFKKPKKNVDTLEVPPKVDRLISCLPKIKSEDSVLFPKLNSSIPSSAKINSGALMVSPKKDRIKQPLSKNHSYDFEFLPKLNRSIPRLPNTFSSPPENLNCECIAKMPSLKQTRRLLLQQENKSDNQSNRSLVSLLNYFNNNNLVKPKYMSIRKKMNNLMKDVKFDPQFKRIQSDFDDNYLLLGTLSHQDQPDNTDTTFEETVTDRSIVLNMISTSSSTECAMLLKNETSDYYNILNSFLSSCGYQLRSPEELRNHKYGRKDFANDVFHSLELEQDVLYKNYIIHSINSNETDNPIIYNEESTLMDSLKLYAKYAS